MNAQHFLAYGTDVYGRVNKITRRHSLFNNRIILRLFALLLEMEKKVNDFLIKRLHFSLVLAQLPTTVCAFGAERGKHKSYFYLQINEP